MLAALLAVFVVSVGATTSNNTKPNILVLFVDDLGYGDLSCFGHPTIRTPNIDSLALSGIRFTEWYSGFHICSPSRAAMMTGRLPIRSGMMGSWTGGVFGNDAVGGLPLNETTLAELLDSAGYRTAAIGKWHLGQREEFLPTNRGFDSYLGVPYSHDMGSTAWDLDPDAPNISLPLLNGTTIIQQPVDLNLLTSMYIEEASSVIKSSVQADQPFFLYMAFNHVHVPDFVSPMFCNTSLRGRFGDAVAEMDYAVGQILAAVSAAGADENTIVFFTSDNGPWLIKGLSGGSAGMLQGGKQTTWEGGVRVPGMVRWTGKVPANTVSSEMVATYDIFPTALALAGVSLPTDRVFDGKDLSQVLFAGAASPHECVFHYKGTPGSECPSHVPDCPGLWAVRCGSYKLHYATSTWQDSSNATFWNPPLMFQIENDPSEAFPLNSASTEYQAALQTITAAVLAHKATLTPVPNQVLMGGDPAYELNCASAPGSTCTPDNYNVFVCTPV